MIVEEEITNSFEFYDEKHSVLLTLFAHGTFEQKDIEIFAETDSIEVKTPFNEIWKFQLYNQVHPDRNDVEINFNAAMTQTSIEIRLTKQNPRVDWPQIHSFHSMPIVPNRDESIWHDCRDVTMSEENFTDLSLKKLRTDFNETNEKFTSFIYVRNATNVRVDFTETNFTLFFQSSDENFLKQNSIRSDENLRLVVRVKERIVPSRCSFNVTTTTIEIVLFKENLRGKKWDRLETNEHSETTSVNNQKTILAVPPPPPPPPLPTPILNFNRKSDKFPSASDFNSAIERKESKGFSSSSNVVVSLGFTGINNPANSCFMNAAIQCLSNTRELRDYFLQNYHSLEINKVNPLGMKGVMAEEFATLIRHLWSGKASWVNGNGIRSLLARRHQEFANNGQHDAQELLTVLLDAIHEDLNRILSKPLVPPVEDQGRPDQVVADEYWRGYLSRNDSIIVQLFTGQFKSKTKCPQCLKESVTFDPFTSLSVPLPKRTAIDVIVLYRTDDKSPMKFRLIISADGTIGELKRLLSPKSGLVPAKMFVYRVRGNRTVDVFKDDDRIPVAGQSFNYADVIFVSETLISSECQNEKIFHLTFFQRIFKIPTNYVSNCAYCQVTANPHKPSICCKKCFQTFYCDESCQRLHSIEHRKYCGLRSVENYEIIGIPFIVSLPQSKVNCENIFEQLKIFAKRSVEIRIERPKIDDDENDSFSDIENVDWPTIKETLTSADSWSICRLGDYFVKQGGKMKRRRPQSTRNRREKVLKTSQSIPLTNGDHDDEDFLDEIHATERLFRLTPQISTQNDENLRPIIESNDESNEILRRYSIFSIDWFTDNKADAPLRIIPSKNRHGINGLIEDKSVSESMAGDQDITLQQCLQTFIEPEVLGEDDKWYCPHCKEHMRAEKKMSVWRLPPILIIQLKRFKYYHGCSAFASLMDTRAKIDTNVKFPVYNLDMTPFCCSSLSNGNDLSQSRYDLFGVINHRGSAWFGHYTSYARLLGHNDPAKTEIGWRNFDDERVSNLGNEKDLNRPDAYVLFYRHRHLSIDFNLPTPPAAQPLTTTTTTTTATMNVTSKQFFEEPISMETNTLDDIRDLIS